MRNLRRRRFTTSPGVSDLAFAHIDVPTIGHALRLPRRKAQSLQRRRRNIAQGDHREPWVTGAPKTKPQRRKRTLPSSPRSTTARFPVPYRCACHGHPIAQTPLPLTPPRDAKPWVRIRVTDGAQPPSATLGRVRLPNAQPRSPCPTKQPSSQKPHGLR